MEPNAKRGRYKAEVQRPQNKIIKSVLVRTQQTSVHWFEQTSVWGSSGAGFKHTGNQAQVKPIRQRKYETESLVCISSLTHYYYVYDNTANEKMCVIVLEIDQ